MVRDKKCINTLHVNLEQIMENAVLTYQRQRID